MPMHDSRNSSGSQPELHSGCRRGPAISISAPSDDWCIVGILLPTMHQSSLGALMLIAGPRLHPLWNSGWLPLLFLLSCIGMGYAAVVFEALLSSWMFKTRPEREMLSGIAA